MTIDGFSIGEISDDRNHRATEVILCFYLNHRLLRMSCDYFRTKMDISDPHSSGGGVLKMLLETSEIEYS